MNRIEKMERIHNLECEKEILESKLNKVDNALEDLQSDCKHIVAVFHDEDEELRCKCLLCSRELTDEDHIRFNVRESGIDFDEYFKGSGHSSRDCFDSLQTLMLGMLKMKPSIDDRDIMKEYLNLLTPVSKKDTKRRANIK